MYLSLCPQPEQYSKVIGFRTLLDRCGPSVSAVWTLQGQRSQELSLAEVDIVHSVFIVELVFGEFNLNFQTSVRRLRWIFPTKKARMDQGVQPGSMRCRDRVGRDVFFVLSDKPNQECSLNAKTLMWNGSTKTYKSRSDLKKSNSLITCLSHMVCSRAASRQLKGASKCCVCLFVCLLPHTASLLLVKLFVLIVCERESVWECLLGAALLCDL